MDFCTTPRGHGSQGSIGRLGREADVAAAVDPFAPVRVAGNLPYNVSTPILSRLLDLAADGRRLLSGNGRKDRRWNTLIFGKCCPNKFRFSS